MRLALIVAVLALPSFACSAANDSASSSEDVVFHPSGPGGDVTLTLNVPKDVWQAHYFCGTTEVQPNVATHLPYQPGSDGRTAISVQVAAEDGTLLLAASTFAIVMGDNTITFGEMHLDHSAPSGSPTITLDQPAASGVLAYTNDAGKTQNVWTLLNGETPPDSVYVGRPLVPTFLGHYTFTSGLQATVTPFDVKAGDVVTGEMAETNLGANVSLVQDPTAAQFPNGVGVPQTYDFACTHDGALPAPGVTLYAQQWLSVVTTSVAHCTWGYGAARVSFDVSPGGSYQAQIHHLDVDDVELTDSSGQKASGTYVVSLPDGTPVTSAQPTKTSVDLPPGTYTITTTYAGTDGFNHTTSGTQTL